MLKYLTKIAMDILPSVVATVIGAYIVNHYINAKPAADTPAAAVSTADPKGAGKPAETASIPEPGIKAKGISEKALIEKTASERPAEAKPLDGKSADGKSETKAADAKPAESAPAEPRRHPLLSFSRDKAVAEKPKTAPSPSPTAVAVAPAATTPATPAPAANLAPATEASAAPVEEHRDAAELARAAIERLRGMSDKTVEKPQEKGQEAARSAEPPRIPEPRIQEPPHTVAAVPVRPLPPPITVSAPPVEPGAPAQQPAYPPYTASVDPNRPTPPADIPLPPQQPPLDLRADAGAASPRDHARNVAEDMLSAAKSVFHAVIPGASSSSSNKFAD